MVRHTLKSLGPKVLSTRMLREYVNRLYAPAAVSSRAMNDSYEGAAELAAWKSRVAAGWSEVHVDHVESEGLSDSPEIGGGLDLHVFVSLGALSPDDVEVEVVHGRVKGEDELVDTTTTPSRSPRPTRVVGTGSTATSSSPVRAPSATPSGSCRKNPSLASPAELGLVAFA